MLVAAGFTTYLARSAEDIRSTFITNWAEEAGLRANFSYTKLLSSESVLLKWKAEGLPADSLSQENGLVIANAQSRVPFVIDPAGSATNWLKAYFAKDSTRPLESVKAFDSRFVAQVELAVRFGKSLLLLDMDGVEPMLYPLCRKDLTKQGSRSCVVVGDKVMDWNDNFRMCLVTRNPNIELNPDTSALVVTVNFSVTRSGLAGQLLGVTIQHEQPELEIKKTKMLQQEEDFKVQLADLEASLLQSLSEAEGELLENVALIESLTNTKRLAKQIQESLEASAEASLKLDEQRDAYKPFAVDGSRLFFLIQQLVTINGMYRFSLSCFIELFEAVLDKEMSSRDLRERLEQLTPLLEIDVLFYVGRALFKSDRTMFAIHLVHGMRPDRFGENEWEYLTDQLISDGGAGGSVRRAKGVPEWVPSDRHGGFAELVSNFPKLVHSLDLENSAKWKRFVDSSDCGNFPVKASGAQQLMLTKAVRPDRLFSSMESFASEALRVSSLAPQAMSFKQTYEQLAKTATQPILLITTPGADPGKELSDFASEEVGREHYRDLAMVCT
jgi:dynein heavy chain 2